MENCETVKNVKQMVIKISFSCIIPRAYINLIRILFLNINYYFPLKKLPSLANSSSSCNLDIAFKNKQAKNPTNS